MRESQKTQELGLLAKALGSRLAAARILEKFETLDRVERAGVSAVARVGKISKQRVERLLAAFFLGRRAAISSWPRAKPFVKAQQVFSAYGPLLSSLDHEVFLAIALDAKNRRISEVTVARGATVSCPVSMREAFVNAIREGAAGILFLHNHPSGNPLPSEEDCTLTIRLHTTGHLLGIPVMDHVIIGGEGFFSFAKEGLLLQDED